MTNTRINLTAFLILLAACYAVDVTVLGLENARSKRHVSAFLLQTPAFDKASLLVEDFGPKESEHQTELYYGFIMTNYLQPGEKHWRISFLDQAATANWLSAEKDRD